MLRFFLSSKTSSSSWHVICQSWSIFAVIGYCQSSDTEEQARPASSISPYQHVCCMCWSPSARAWLVRSLKRSVYSSQCERHHKDLYCTCNGGPDRLGPTLHVLVMHCFYYVRVASFLDPVKRWPCYKYNTVLLSGLNDRAWDSRYTICILYIYKLVCVV